MQRFLQDHLLVNCGKHEFAGLDGGEFGCEGREAGGDEVCVDEGLAVGFVAEEFFGESGFPCTVWPAMMMIWGEVGWGGLGILLVVAASKTHCRRGRLQCVTPFD